ncbi:Uncharacterized protein Adt_06137 [Abeliophyllum distichum]|uniref:Uncharacterized protein n=1 Tax=Abeliophyllum distichum TaxID=126358 RepID=A0ABD1V620_9LAMI
MAHNGHEQAFVEVHRPLRDYIIPAVGENFTCLVPPTIPVNNYEIKPRTIQLVQQTVQFHGLLDEDPHEHRLSNKTGVVVPTNSWLFDDMSGCSDGRRGCNLRHHLEENQGYREREVRVR